MRLRKTSLLLTVLIISSVLLVACGAASSSSKSDITAPDTQTAITDNTNNAVTPDTNGTGSSAIRTFTLEELAKYDGKNGNPAYIAVDGKVYDVSNVPQWKNGEHQGYSAGKDLTKEIKEYSPHGTAVLEGIPVIGTLKN